MQGFLQQPLSHWSGRKLRPGIRKSVGGGRDQQIGGVGLQGNLPNIGSLVLEHVLLALLDVGLRDSDALSHMALGGAIDQKNPLSARGHGGDCGRLADPAVALRGTGEWLQELQQSDLRLAPAGHQVVAAKLTSVLRALCR